MGIGRSRRRAQANSLARLVLQISNEASSHRSKDFQNLAGLWLLTSTDKASQPKLCRLQLLGETRDFLQAKLFASSIRVILLRLELRKNVDIVKSCGQLITALRQLYLLECVRRRYLKHSKCGIVHSCV